jgi:hypothetical protein
MFIPPSVCLEMAPKEVDKIKWGIAWAFELIGIVIL